TVHACAAVGVASLQVVNEVLTEIKVHGSFAKFFQQITEVGVVEGSGALFATEGLSLALWPLPIENRAHNWHYGPCTFHARKGMLQRFIFVNLSRSRYQGAQ